jgi:hypothetical protein
MRPRYDTFRSDYFEGLALVSLAEHFTEFSVERITRETCPGEIRATMFPKRMWDQPQIDFIAKDRLCNRPTMLIEYKGHRTNKRGDAFSVSLRKYQYVIFASRVLLAPSFFAIPMGDGSTLRIIQLSQAVSYKLSEQGQRGAGETRRDFEPVFRCPVIYWGGRVVPRDKYDREYMVSIPLSSNDIIIPVRREHVDAYHATTQETPELLARLEDSACAVDDSQGDGEVREGDRGGVVCGREGEPE